MAASVGLPPSLALVLILVSTRPSSSLVTLTPFPFFFSSRHHFFYFLFFSPFIVIFYPTGEERVLKISPWNKGGPAGFKLSAKSKLYVHDMSEAKLTAVSVCQAAAKLIVVVVSFTPLLGEK